MTLQSLHWKCVPPVGGQQVKRKRSLWWTSTTDIYWEDNLGSSSSGGRALVLAQVEASWSSARSTGHGGEAGLSLIPTPWSLKVWSLCPNPQPLSFSCHGPFISTPPCHLENSFQFGIWDIYRDSSKSVVHAYNSFHPSSA